MQVGVSQPGADRRKTPGSIAPAPVGNAPSRFGTSSVRFAQCTSCGSAGQAPITTPAGTARRSNASMVSAVWLRVPRPARATTTAGAPNDTARSATVHASPDGRSPIGTSSPPAPSTSTRSCLSTSARIASTAVYSSSGSSPATRAAASGASGSG